MILGYNELVWTGHAAELTEHSSAGPGNISNIVWRPLGSFKTLKTATRPIQASSLYSTILEYLRFYRSMGRSWGQKCTSSAGHGTVWRSHSLPQRYASLLPNLREPAQFSDPRLFLLPPTPSSEGTRNGVVNPCNRGRKCQTAHQIRYCH